MEILHFSQRLSGDFNARHVQDREAARESAPQHAHRTWPAVQAAASVPLRAGILYTCCGQVAPRLSLKKLVIKLNQIYDGWFYKSFLKIQN